MGGVLAALMSSFDSALNSMSNVTNHDFYQRYLNPDASEGHYVKVVKRLTVFFGILLLGFSLSQYNQQTSTAAEHFTRLDSLVLAPIGSFFLLGILSKRINTPGVLCGALAAIFLSLGFNGLPPFIQPFFNRVELFQVGSVGKSFLDKGQISTDLRKSFLSHGIPLSVDAMVEVKSSETLWQIRNGERFYLIEKEQGQLKVSHEPINWMWIPILSMAVNLLIGYLASLLFRPPPQHRLEGLTLVE